MLQVLTVYLRCEHCDVLVIRKPSGNGGRAHVETVVRVRRILHPPEQRQLKLDTNLSSGPKGVNVMLHH